MEHLNLITLTLMMLNTCLIYTKEDISDDVLGFDSFVHTNHGKIRLNVISEKI